MVDGSGQNPNMGVIFDLIAVKYGYLKTTYYVIVSTSLTDHSKNKNEAVI